MLAGTLLAATPNVASLFRRAAAVTLPDTECTGPENSSSKSRYPAEALKRGQAALACQLANIAILVIIVLYVVTMK